MAENEKKVKKGKASNKNTSKKANNELIEKKAAVKKGSNTKKASKKTDNAKAEKKVTNSGDNVKKKSTEVKAEKEKKENIKQARKQLYYNSNNSSSNELSKLIKIVLIVTGIIIVFYGVTVVVTNKAKEAAKENEEAVEIQYDSIMIGSMLKIDGSFYVLIEDEDDIRLPEYNTLIQTIKANEDAPTIYTADLSSGFNKKYLSDKTNYDDNMETFKVKGTTLVRISNHKITDVYDNYDAISDQLNKLD